MYSYSSQLIRSGQLSTAYSRVTLVPYTPPGKLSPPLSGSDPNRICIPAGKSVRDFIPAKANTSDRRTPVQIPVERPAGPQLNPFDCFIMFYRNYHHHQQQQQQHYHYRYEKCFVDVCNMSIKSKTPLTVAKE